MGAFAIAYLEGLSALALARTLGDRAFEGFALLRLSNIALLLGQDAEALAHATAAMEIAIETQAKETERLALVALAAAELSLGRADAASVSFSRALDLADSVGRGHQDAWAGMARVALAQNSPTLALHQLEPMLDELADGGALSGGDERHLIHLTCWQALDRAGDPRAGWMLDLAHGAVQAIADSITDPELRTSFLTRHPTNRAIVDAWRAISTSE